MATYYDIFGQKVQYLASDPSPVAVGQVWYNSTSNTAKVQGVTTSSSWSTGGNMNDAQGGNGGGDSQTSAVALQGTLGAVTTVEEYDGTSWTNGPNSTNTYGSRSAGGASASAGLIGGYSNSPFTTYTVLEEWNGLSFSGGGSSNTPGYSAGTCYGVNLNALGWVGRDGPNNTANEHYDGSSWTTVNPSPPGQRGGNLAGVLTSAIMASGFVPPNNTTVNSFDYDGTSWTAITNLPSGSDSINSGSGATSSSAYMKYGGSREPSLGRIDTSDFWNGSAWSNETSLPAPRSGSNGGVATSYTGALMFGGSPSGTTTFEFTASGVPETQTLTTT